MKIVNIEYITKKSAVVTLEDGYTFPLHKEHINHYKLCIGYDMKQEQLAHIIENHVKDMARSCILDSLARTSKTRIQAREVLSKKMYPDSIIDEVIGQCEEYGYIDDYSYAKNYYELKRSFKSIYYIKNMLRTKGISDDIIAEVFAQEDYSAEIEQINKILDSRIKNKETVSIEEKNKIIASLFRKGYNTSNIYFAISQYLA